MVSSINVVQVSYMRRDEKILMGRLVYKDRKIFFEYAADFLKTGLELSPFKLPLKIGVASCEEHVFDGLFGVFNDSLPDGWGRLLLDRKLMSLGLNPQNLTPLDRLCYVGAHGMGALSYVPEITDGPVVLHCELDEIAEECLQVQSDGGDFFVEDLLKLNGSSAGARPKILVTLVKKSFQTTDSRPNVFHNDWIIKFNSTLDPVDIGLIEYAYHLMAKAAGLDLPEATLFPSKKSAGYFGVKRFDRVDAGYLHMHTISGLLHADYRIPSLDYETLMKATWHLTKQIKECEKQFRHAVFNAFSHNRDDHGKNFSFLMSPEGLWSVSPAYDLTFSSGPAGEHCTTFMGEGKHIKRQHLLELAQIGGIKPQRAVEIIEEVRQATSNWRDFAETVGLTKKSNTMIQTALKKITIQ